MERLGRRAAEKWRENEGVEMANENRKTASTQKRQGGGGGGDGWGGSGFGRKTMK